jgi:hypothetical protein
MPQLTTMPSLVIEQKKLAAFGRKWSANGQRLLRTAPYSSIQLGAFFSSAVSVALSQMLGDIPKIPARQIPKNKKLSTAQTLVDAVEFGKVRIDGGVRTQNFDVGYRPDGVRFAFDCKTLNDRKSIGKNWQNMINDLAAEAATVHSRYAHAVVGFLVAFPEPAVSDTLRADIVNTLERISQRTRVQGAEHMAEAIALVVWNPADGTIDRAFPSSTSPLRYERFSQQVQAVYMQRNNPGSQNSSTDDQDYEFDVAISYARPQRPLADRLAGIVSAAGFKVFYDSFFPDRLWGTELPVSLDEIYRKKSRYCVMFVSQDYKDRMWTNHERSSAQARALEQRGREYILPIKVEDVELPGMPPNVGYLSTDSYSIDQIAEILISKLGGTQKRALSPRDNFLE